MNQHTLDKLEFDRVLAMVARHARTPLGRHMALKARPGQNPEIVKRWLSQAAEAIRAIDLYDYPPLGGVQDVREMLERTAGERHLTAEDFARLASTFEATRPVRGWLAGLPGEKFPTLFGFAERIADLVPLAGQIRRVIGPQGGVRDDASDRLLQIRSRIQDTQAAARAAIDRILEDPNLNRWLAYVGATYHDDRLVVPLQAKYQGRIKGIVHRTSDSGETLFIEPESAVSAHNLLVQLRAEESEEVGRLLWQLTHMVRLNAEEARRTVNSLALLDLLCAKAGFARDVNGVVAEVSEQAVYHLVRAVHPLLLEKYRAKGMQLDFGLAADGVSVAKPRLQAQQQPSDDASEPARQESIQQIAAVSTPTAAVPIDIRVGDDFDLLLITGPNTGGKTVALKTLGLLTAMHMAGLPIPAAAGSMLPMVNEILIDIGDEQSLAQSLSTFAAHCANLLTVLKRAKADTLVLLDELGAGTDPDEGAALGQAVLDELLRRAARCVVTTHFNALKAYAYRRPRVQVGSVEFDHETLAPKYTLVIGEPGQSNALKIAERLGIPSRVIHQAQNYLDRRFVALQQAIQGTAERAREAEAARVASEQAEAEARKNAEKLAAKLEQVREEKARFDEWLRRVGELKAGDEVFVRKFSRKGRVLRSRLEKQEITVELGGLEVTVNMRELDVGDLPTPLPPAPLPKFHRKAAPAASPVAEPAKPVGPLPRKLTRPTDPLRPSRPSRRVITPQKAQHLTPGDEIWIATFRRKGRVLRVDLERERALVSAGAFELEVPFVDLREPFDEE